LCTLYACPEGLFPKEACDQAKHDMHAAGVKFTQHSEVRMHPMKDGRCVPLSMLRKRLGIEPYEKEAPFADLELAPGRVRLKLAQHTGVPARPVVRAGQKVRNGEPVAAVGEEELGASIHASISGTVRSVTDSFVEIEA
jgi:hypothetical protein